MLMAWVGVLLVAVDTHDTANDQSQQSEALRRLFIYQVVTQIQRGS
jgi:hypothetical protein